MMRLLVEKTPLKARPALLAKLALVGLILGGTATAAVKPTAARIGEISSWLPATSAPVGRPASDRAAWDAVASRLPLREILVEADRLVNVAPPAVTDALYLEYSRTGSRTGYENVYNSRRDRLTTFAWAEALDGRGRYLAAVQREVDAILDEKAWTLPAHDASLNNFNGRVVEVDLGAAMRGWSMATVAGWLGESLGTARLTRLQAEIRRRITDPYLNAIRNGPVGGMWWVHTNSNWNAVCHAGVVGATLAAVTDRALRAEVVASAESNLPYFVSGFTDDGYCTEGIGYWSYGFGHHVLLGEAVSAATGGRLQLVRGQKLERITAYPVGMAILPRVYPAFSDNSTTVQPANWVAPLARRLLDGGTAPARLPSMGWAEVARDQLYISAIRVWTPSVAASALPPQPELRHWFAGAQVLIARAGDDFGAAIKGGNNDELHNHNDLGSFVIALGTTALLVDPGSEVYTARTFSAQRYDSKVLNSYGHPVPVVAGRLQSTGAAYAAKVLATEWTRDRDRLLLDLKGGYSVPSLRRLEREFVCRRGVAEGFVITDEFEFASPESFGTALVTFGAWRAIDASTLEIGTGASRLRVRIEAEGGQVAVRAETIEETLPGGAKPTRLGLDFTQPLARGKVRLTITRAEPLLTADAASLAVSAAAKLGNLSTLNVTQPGEGGLIAGFSLAGTGRQQVLLRAVGPGIGQFGVTSTLRDPVLILRAANGAEVTRNDNWPAAIGPAFGRVGAFPLAAGSADAAVLADLSPGSYTAQIESADGAAGNTLVELYDAGADGPRLVNLSTRGTVSPGAPLTLGLSVGAGAARWFLLRGVGPGLAPFGVTTALADPQLSVFRDGTTVARNDDWSASHWTSELAAAAATVQAFALPDNSADAALIVQLPPGNYTFQIAGKGGATGTVLGEAYELP